MRGNRATGTYANLSPLSGGAFGGIVALRDRAYEADKVGRRRPTGAIKDPLRLLGHYAEAKATVRTNCPRIARLIGILEKGEELAGGYFPNPRGHPPGILERLRQGPIGIGSQADPPLALHI